MLHLFAVSVLLDYPIMVHQLFALVFHAHVSTPLIYITIYIYDEADKDTSWFILWLSAFKRLPLTFFLFHLNYNYLLV